MSTKFLHSIPGCAKPILLVAAAMVLLSTQCYGQSVTLASGTVRIEGTSGNDRATVRKGARNQVIVKLNRKVFRFAGMDVLRIQFYGYQGNDYFFNNSNLPAQASGGMGDDYLFASTGTADFFGESGDDILVGGSQRDFLFGNAGSDLIFGNAGNDLIYGDEMFYTLLRRDVQEGENFNEDERFEAGDDLIYAGAGNDYVEGNGGDDRVYAGSGNDVVKAHSGNDRVFGSSGDDCLEGGDGDDFLNGGSGADRLAGGFDNDRLFGMSGNDILYGGNGLDRLNGGSGIDVEIQNGPNYCEGDEEPNDDVPS